MGCVGLACIFHRLCSLWRWFGASLAAGVAAIMVYRALTRWKLLWIPVWDDQWGLSFFDISFAVRGDHGWFQWAWRVLPLWSTACTHYPRPAKAASPSPQITQESRQHRISHSGDSMESSLILVYRGTNSDLKNLHPLVVLRVIFLYKAEGYRNTKSV